MSQLQVIAKSITAVLKDIFKWIVITYAIASFVGSPPSVETMFLQKIGKYVRPDSASESKLHLGFPRSASAIR